MSSLGRIGGSITLVWLLSFQDVYAHDPIFGIGPHVLFKDGVETAVEIHQEKAGEETESEFALQLVYGLSSDWAAGLEIPYSVKKESGKTASGAADVVVFSKYRFWRHDSFGAQDAAAVAIRINFANGDETTAPPLGNGATDVIAGLSYGHEALKWYRWASVRYRHNGENDAGFQVGAKWLIDFAGGWRPTPPVYLNPDTVWYLELNGEIGQRTELGGVELANSGGNEWFLSPGLFWTLRNFAVKAGIQIPIASDLNGAQDTSDYRFKLALEWHL